MSPWCDVWEALPRIRDAGLDYQVLLDWSEGEIVATARTRLTRRITIGRTPCYLKVQHIPHPRPRYFLRPSAYLREARALDRMASLGLRVPERMAVGERRRAGFIRDALLLTRAVPGAIDLLTWSRQGFASREDLPSWEELCAELEATVARIHTRGWRFGDLKWRNILAAPADESGSHLVFIDQRRFGRPRLRSTAEAIRAE